MKDDCLSYNKTLGCYCIANESDSILVVQEDKLVMQLAGTDILVYICTECEKEFTPDMFDFEDQTCLVCQEEL